MISILRLNHRIQRDIRVTTHLALTARALLANNLYYTGQRDKNLENSISRINDFWGSDFRIHYLENYMDLLNGNEAIRVHLTMYGRPFQDVIKEFRNTAKDIIIIVGGKKVPAEIFETADFNVSVTNQPISEVSALAILLNSILGPDILKSEFKNAKISIVPQTKGKKITKA